MRCMTSILLLFYLFVKIQSQSAATDCSTISPTWLDWGEWSICSDTCGSCGIHMRSRTCLTSSNQCVCEGDATAVEYCNLEICRYPRTTCCNNLKVTSYSGRFACLSSSTSG